MCSPYPFIRFHTSLPLPWPLIRAKKKQEKRGIRQEQIYEAAKMNTRSNSMASKASISQEKTDALNKAEEARAHAKSGSLASKANLVKDFNERNNK